MHCLSKCPSECSDLVPLRMQSGSVRFSQSRALSYNAECFSQCLLQCSSSVRFSQCRTLRYNAEWFSQCPLRCREVHSVPVTMQRGSVSARYDAERGSVRLSKSRALRYNTEQFSQSRVLRYNAVVQSGSVRAELSVTMQWFSQVLSEQSSPLQCRVGSVRAELSVTMQSGFSQVQSGQSSPLQCRAVQSGSLACRPTPPKKNKKTNNNKTKNKCMQQAY